MADTPTSTRPADSVCASDTRTSGEIIAAYLADSETESLATVHYRGGSEEFQAGLTLIQSDEPNERAAGADVLGQLGWSDRTFLDESVEVLLIALNDAQEQVVQSALIALGHRASARAIDPVLRFVDHPSAKLRDGAVFALMPHDTPRVVDALIKLSEDVDGHVRDWATFTLAQQFESDTPALRSALCARLADEFPEVRGEAILGLAQRRDLAVLPAIVRELNEEVPGDLVMEAAELLADPQLLPSLQALDERLTSAQNEDLQYLREWVAEVIAATSSPSASQPLPQQP